MVLVQVSDGTLEGTHEQNEYGGSFYSFKGVPYAEPPLGDLRFKAPQPLKPWVGVRSAKTFGDDCYQLNPLFREHIKISGSEDCLYLQFLFVKILMIATVNVYTPNLKPNKPLAVMVWIHGGGFFCGSGSDEEYGPGLLIRHDVVLVNINYRLDILGFLCLDIEEVPGNAGMKDQVAALQWIKKNISNFGGDPDNVTIFGESAGGASVSYHLISPMSKGLFKRAISQSGTSIGQWAVVNEPREKAIKFARKLGFTSTDPYEIYEFLKSLPVETIVKVEAHITCDELAIMPLAIHFAVVSEKKFTNRQAFFSGDVLEVLRGGIHEGVDVMNGYTEHEGIFSLVIKGDFQNVLKYAELSEFFCPAPIRYHCTKKQILEVGRKMRTYYLKNDLISKEKAWDLIRFMGLDDFIFDAIRWQKIVVKSSRNKLYLYKFTCKSDRNILTDLFGQRGVTGPGTFVAHAEDCMYLFTKKVDSKMDLDSREFKMVEKVNKIWTNFAKYGDPTPDGSLGARWAPYTPQQQEFMDIGEELIPGREPEREDVQFWETIYRQYLPAHLP